MHCASSQAQQPNMSLLPIASCQVTVAGILWMTAEEMRERGYNECLERIGASDFPIASPQVSDT